MAIEQTQQATALQPATQSSAVAPMGRLDFYSADGFALAQRMASAFSASTLVPTQYQGQQNVPNAIIAIELSNRLGISPFMGMQNIHVIQGRPSLSASLVTACINASGRFSPLRFKINKLGPKTVQGRDESGTREIKIQDLECFAYAQDVRSGEIIEGPTVSIEMAVLEGWYTKKGSKWRSMPDLMLRYRAAAFFGRLYAPDIMFGMQTAEELEDVYGDTAKDVTPQDTTATPVLNDAIKAAAAEEKPARAVKPATRKSKPIVIDNPPPVEDAVVEDVVVEQVNQDTGEVIEAAQSDEEEGLWD